MCSARWPGGNSAPFSSLPIVNGISAPASVRSVNPRTFVRPCESIFTRRPVTGEASVAGLASVPAGVGVVLDPQPPKANTSSMATSTAAPTDPRANLTRATSPCRCCRA
jgi:hypothetical protein